MTDKSELKQELDVWYHRCEELKKDRGKLVHENIKLREIIQLMANEFSIDIDYYEKEVGLND